MKLNNVEQTRVVTQRETFTLKDVQFSNTYLATSV